MSEDRLGHFRIIDEIGRGGMGAVYRALDERLDREVALKVLQPSPGAGADVFQRLIHEARAAARIEHPNIATVYELGEESGTSFIAMELVRGETLRQRLGRGPLPPREVVEIATQVCRGLDAAHRQGIVHRDVKPENIVVTGDGTVKILDFGVALLRSRMDLQRTAGVDEITKTFHLEAPTSIAGTVPYMSPEQLAGATVDGRSDLFSLGIVIHELLSGERPFRGHTSEKLVEAILHEDPPSPADTSPLVDRQLAGIVRRCLAKKPADRFQSAGDLMGKLREWLEPATAWRRTWVRVALATVLAMACIGSWFAWRSWRAPVPPSGADFTVAVAPFVSVTGASRERGRAYQELVEREIRKKAEGISVRIREGELREPIESESQAREAGQRLGVDAVCWGKLLGVGGEEEVEARITPINRIEQAAVGSVEVSFTSDPKALLELVRKIPLDSPRQIELIGSKAEEIADLVTTLVGLAQIRAGQYAKASTTLAALKTLTPDLRFYQGLAKLREDDHAAAQALFRQVLAEDPKHSGARLGILVSRSAKTFNLRDEESRKLTLEALGNDPVDPKFNLLLTVDTMSTCLAGEQACHEMVAKYRIHLLSLCERSETDRFPSGMLAFMGFIAATLENKGAMTGPSPVLDELARCRTFIADVERQTLGKAFVCMMMQLSSQQPIAASARCCDDWFPDPFAVPPLMYAFVSQSCAKRDRAGKPIDLSEIANRDPRLEERVRDWAYAISAEEAEADIGYPKALDWLKRHPGSGTEKGRRKALEGMLLIGAHRLDDAQRSFKEAEAILGADEEVLRGLAIGHLAAGQFDRALTVLGSSAVPERPLALAASGHIKDAFQALTSEGDEAAMTRIMDSLALEIEKDEIIRKALSLEFGRQIQEAASKPGFDYSFDWNFHDNANSSTGFEFQQRQSFKFSLSYRLPKDPLSLLTVIQSLASSPGANATPADREHLADFLKRLSAFVREAVSVDAPKEPGLELVIRNDTAKETSIYWMRDGTAVFYRKLAAGYSYTQPTFSGNRWRAVVVGREKPLEFEIRGQNATWTLK